MTETRITKGKQVKAGIQTGRVGSEPMEKVGKTWNEPGHNRINEKGENILISSPFLQIWNRNKTETKTRQCERGISKILPAHMREVCMLAWNSPERHVHISDGNNHTRLNANQSVVSAKGGGGVKITVFISHFTLLAQCTIRHGRGTVWPMDKVMLSTHYIYHVWGGIWAKVYIFTLYYVHWKKTSLSITFQSRAKFSFSVRTIVKFARARESACVCVAGQAGWW